MEGNMKGKTGSKENTDSRQREKKRKEKKRKENEKRSRISPVRLLLTGI